MPGPKKTTFPLKGANYFLGCDGGLQDDGTYTVRILLCGIRSAADARKAALWLQSVITAQMPRTFTTRRECKGAK